jgi:hypothetical protein
MRGRSVRAANSAFCEAAFHRHDNVRLYLNDAARRLRRDFAPPRALMPQVTAIAHHRGRAPR